MCARAGHYHKPHTVAGSRITYIGSPYQGAAAGAAAAAAADAAAAAPATAPDAAGWQPLEASWAVLGVAALQLRAIATALRLSL